MMESEKMSLQKLSFMGSTVAVLFLFFLIILLIVNNIIFENHQLSGRCLYPFIEIPLIFVVPFFILQLILSGLIYIFCDKSNIIKFSNLEKTLIYVIPLLISLAVIVLADFRVGSCV